MKYLFLYLTVFIIQFSFAQTDTLNRTDTLTGKKYGYWIIYGRSKPNSGYALEDKVEEGKYVDNRKQGLWKSYFAGNKIKSEIEFKNNRPYGKYIIYDSTGAIKDSGVWKGTIVHGEFRRNDYGKVKYSPNGSILPVVDSLQFKADSTLTNPSKVNSESYYQFYNSDCKCFENLNETVSGYKKLYNGNRQITHDGEFMNGKIINGKRFIYDKNGLLDKIEIYKNGKYYGDAQIED